MTSAVMPAVSAGHQHQRPSCALDQRRAGLVRRDFVTRVRHGRSWVLPATGSDRRTTGCAGRRSVAIELRKNWLRRQALCRASAPTGTGWPCESDSGCCATGGVLDVARIRRCRRRGRSVNCRFSTPSAIASRVPALTWRTRRGSVGSVTRVDVVADHQDPRRRRRRIHAGRRLQVHDRALRRVALVEAAADRRRRTSRSAAVRPP